MVKAAAITCNLIDLKIKDWHLHLVFSFESSLPAEEIGLLAVNRKSKEELSFSCEKQMNRKPGCTRQ